ncbi:MAG: UDP-N-acetylglucosamine 2-epimerase (hydrolyzing) [Flavobacteriales bacterium]|jgi:GDP/UDP-N,N'-diacetylbacillosamine 2-epimerase (hydrolysing)|nr:UDP-N-acetylglucosamine 2-epimerase (hydrolyzing) [Flavobacteriales bacterium]
MKQQRKILAVTGARSEYDILFPVLEKLHQDADFELQVLVTGAHLSENFGRTVQYIEQDGFTIADRVYNLINTDQKIGRIISLGQQISGLAQCFDRIRPDIILIVGDREEAISVSLTGAYMDIAVAHIAGGDVTKDGNIDNSVRYAASKMSHIHFTILEQHRQTLLKLGEDDWRIHTVGNPALDRFLSLPEVSKQELSTNLGFDITHDDYLVLIQHPIITDFANEGKNIRVTLDAIVSTGKKCLINYPNSDAGNHFIIEAYREYSAKHPQLFLFQNLDRITYVNLLRHASCLLGNSSSGLIEAPSLTLPVVNIGARQRGRVSAGNVIFVDNDKTQITSALSKSLHDQQYRSTLKTIQNPYGDGNSSKKIVEILRRIKLDSNLIHKNITYTTNE